jgi:hypothetical protein
LVYNNYYFHSSNYNKYLIYFLILFSKLPKEIWDIILDNCFAEDEFFVVSCKALVKVLAVVSKTFNSELSKRAAIDAAKRKPQYCYPRTLANYCCCNGYASLLKYTIDNKAAFGTEDMRIASKSGHLDCLKVFLDHGCMFSIDRMNEAASNGHMNIVRSCQLRQSLDGQVHRTIYAVKTKRPRRCSYK